MTKTKNLILAIALCVMPLTAGAQGLDPASILKGATNSWPTYSGDYTGRRYSSLTQINQTNVKYLSLAWESQVVGGPGEAGGAGGGFGGGGAVVPTYIGGEAPDTG